MPRILLEVIAAEANASRAVGLFLARAGGLARAILVVAKRDSRASRARSSFLFVRMGPTTAFGIWSVFGAQEEPSNLGDVQLGSSAGGLVRCPERSP